MLGLNFIIIAIVEAVRKRNLPTIFRREHLHKWQIRGRNRYGGETYRICLKCRQTCRRVNKISEPEQWERCDPVKELDDQFDSNDQFIFARTQ